MKKASLEPRPPRSTARPAQEPEARASARRGRPTVLRAARRAAAQAADSLEPVCGQLEVEEARLLAESEGADGTEAGELAGLLGAILVDRLRPALDALRSLAGGSR